MSISAKRFNFLDGETTIGTIDLRSIVDTGVYTAAVDMANIFPEVPPEFNKALGDLNGKLAALESNIANMTASVAKKVASTLDNIINTMSNAQLPEFVTNVLDKLKGLNLDGVKGFFKDVLRIGSTFLCNNLDWLKNLMLGYSIGSNIFSGLLLGLLLSWLDRFCKGFTQGETASADNRSLLGMVVRSTGTKIEESGAVDKFMELVNGVQRKAEDFGVELPIDVGGLIGGVLEGQNPRELISTFAKSEPNSATKKEYLVKLDEELTLHPPTSEEYAKLLSLRGGLSTMPVISYQRQQHVSELENSKDALGSFALNLEGVDLVNININSLDEKRIAMLDKLRSFKSSVMAENDLKSRDHEVGSFVDYDFSKVLPEFDEDQRELISTAPTPVESYRYNGLHPTTTVFIEDTVPGVAKPSRDVLTA